MNKQIKILGLVVLVVVVVLVAGTMLFRARKVEVEPEAPIRIGAILPLTGGGAFWGENARKGIMLALEKINNAGGIDGKRVEVLLEDSKSTPRGAVDAFRKLVYIHNIQSSIVDVISSNVLAIAPIAEKERVVIISPGASSPDITYAGEFVFRNWPSDALSGVELAKFVFKRGFEEVAILYINNAFGKAMEKVFTTAFEESGGSVVIAEPFKPGGIDFRAQVTKVKGHHPQAIVLFVYPIEGVKLIGQIREAGIDVPLFSTPEVKDPSFLEIEAAEGLIFLTPEPPDPTRKEVANFLTTFRAKYGEEPGVVADTAYDVLKLLVKVIKEYGHDGPAIQRGLLGIKNYKGASGTITFDEKGDVLKPFTFKTIRDGKFIIYAEK